MPQAVRDRELLTRGSDQPRRRSRLLKSVGLLTLMGTGLLLFLAWQRDSYHWERQRKDLEQYRAALQKQLESLGRLPAIPPTVPGEIFDRANYIYFDDAIRYYSQRTTKPVIVMVSPKLHRILKPDGRTVIIVESKKLRVEWMMEGSFLRAWDEQRVAARQQTALPPRRTRDAPGEALRRAQDGRCVCRPDSRMWAGHC